MRELFNFRETAEMLFAGDVEALRQAVVFGRIKPLVEVRGLGLADALQDEPINGASHFGRWRKAIGLVDPDDGDQRTRFRLDGWFYVSRADAEEMLAPPHPIPDGYVLMTKATSRARWVTPDRANIEFLDYWFEVMLPVDAELWFSASSIEALRLEGAGVVRSTPLPKGEEKPLATRERNNLLRVIAGLADHAGIDLRGENATGPIELAGQKFDGPDAQTIRKWIAKIREEILPANYTGPTH